MSRLVEDLERVKQARVKEKIIVVESATAPSPAQTPVVKRKAEAYFIGFLVVLLVAFSAAAMAFSLKTSERMDTLERATLAGLKSIEQMRAAQASSASALEELKGRAGKIDDFIALTADQNKMVSVQIDGMAAQGRSLKATLEETDQRLDDLAVAQNTLKNFVQSSNDGLEQADKALEGKYISLNAELKKMKEENPYLYNAY